MPSTAIREEVASEEATDRSQDGQRRDDASRIRSLRQLLFLLGAYVITTCTKQPLIKKRVCWLT